MMRQYSENCLSLSISAKMKPLLIICSGTAPQSKSRTAGINNINMDQGKFWITVSSCTISFTGMHIFLPATHSGLPAMHMPHTLFGQGSKRSRVHQGNQVHRLRPRTPAYWLHTLVNQPHTQGSSHALLDLDPVTQ